MKQKTKSNLITISIIIFILLISSFSIFKSHEETDKEIVQCIGEKSNLYVQLGCSHCKTQENIFGENLEYLTIIDCFYENEKCGEIKATPSWKINNEIYVGVKTIEELKELTKC